MLHNAIKVTTFKERFTDICKESGLSSSRLAKDLHISRQTISAWQTGERSPKEPTIITVARYFGVDEMWLMGFDVPKRFGIDEIGGSGKVDLAEKKLMANPDIRILLTGLSHMPPDQIRRAKDVMKAVFAEYANYFEEEKHDDT